MVKALKGIVMALGLTALVASATIAAAACYSTRFVFH